jgi:hypothetical protein
MGAVWTAALIVAAGSALAALTVSDAAVEVTLGPLAPLAVALGSWRLMERAYRRSPAQLAQLMVRAFVGKLLFFGVYVTLAITTLSLDAAWFVGSFAVSFVVLHLAEAAQLQRLFTG